MSKPETPDTKSRRVGRPTQFGGKRIQVYLDDQTISDAKRLGDGNVSEGIRRAIKLANDSGAPKISA